MFISADFINGMVAGAILNSLLVIFLLVSRFAVDVSEDSPK